MKKSIFSIIAIIAFSALLTSCTNNGEVKPKPNNTRTPETTIVTPSTPIKPTPDKTTPNNVPDTLITPIPTPDTTPVTPNPDNNMTTDTLIPTPDGRLFNRM